MRQAAARAVLRRRQPQARSTNFLSPCRLPLVLLAAVAAAVAVVVVVGEQAPEVQCTRQRDVRC